VWALIVTLPYNATANGVIGMAFDIDTVPLAGLRVEFPTKTATNAAFWGGTQQLSPVRPGHNEILWTKVEGPFYDVVAPAFDPTTIYSIQFHIPTSTSASTTYNFCISNLSGSPHHQANSPGLELRCELAASTAFSAPPWTPSSPFGWCPPKRARIMLSCPTSTMSDFIITTGDTVTFNPNFGPALVVVAPGTITGSSRVNIDGAAACVQGDEASVSAPVTYTNPAATLATPGAETLTISALGADQLGQKTSSTQKPLILKGSTFTALLTVQAPASNPAVGATDPVPMYTGTGQFVTSNVKSKGT
jgi:hypothetical protein